MGISGISEENKRIIMDLDVLRKSNDCRDIVKCLGYLISDSEVWVCMELMSMCFDKLLKQIKTPIPEYILGKLVVSVSCVSLRPLDFYNHNSITLLKLFFKNPPPSQIESNSLIGDCFVLLGNYLCGLFEKLN